MDIKPKNLLKRVLQFARNELERRAVPQDDTARAGARSRFDSDGHERPSASPLQHGEPSESGEPPLPGLEVVRPHEGGPLTLRWAISKADVARARTLISGSSVLCVRLVNFTKGRDDVLREVQDRPNVELRGQCEIGEPPQRAVVSLGLRAGDRFVSIAHHVI
ncbi:MAG: hypothetical protein JWN48_4799 [Myxococcaceae bacterium]|nr:hypothetical protein [Myxococcaceae bacterium]